MSWFPDELEALLTVAAASFDDEGVLLESNAGFLRLLPARCDPSIGSRVASCFVQPTFAAMLGAAAAPEGYSGLMTLGDSESGTRTLRGRVWRAESRIRLLAEYDIVDLERLTDTMLELNRESSLTHHALVRANASLRRQDAANVEASLTDALTGVGNRRRLDQILAVELSRVDRHGGALAVIMADVDHFKRVNDEFGHDVGDKVLARVAAGFRACVRPTDVVTRFGGEEFVILLPHTRLAQAAGKAEQLRVALASDSVPPLAEPVTASFGVVQLAPGEDGDSLLRRVDAAMYAAKVAGRNRVIAVEAPPAS